MKGWTAWTIIDPPARSSSVFQADHSTLHSIINALQLPDACLAVHAPQPTGIIHEVPAIKQNKTSFQG